MRSGLWDESGLLIHARQIRDASRARWVPLLCLRITSWDVVAARNMGDSRGVSGERSGDSGPGRG